MKLCLVLLIFVVPVLFAQIGAKHLTTFVPPEIAAMGITLEPVTDANMELVKSLAGNDYALIQPLLQYAAVLTNGSSHRILGICTRFEYHRTGPFPYPHGAEFIHDHLNVYPPTQINPGESRLYWPNRELDTYFAYAWNRIKLPIPDVGVGPMWQGPRPVEVAAKRVPFEFPDENTYFPEGKKDLSPVTDLKVSIKFVTLERVGLIGPDSFTLQQHRKEFDRKTINNNVEARP